MEHSVQNATIRAIWRYPVKSMGGEKLSEATIATDGLAGDRAYALVDEPDVRVASAKLPRKWGRLLHLRARYASPDTSVTGRSRVQITFPDGEVRMSDDARIDDALSEFVGRRVRLTSQRPGTVSVERLDPLSVEELVVDIGELMPKDRFVDYAPLHVVTTASLSELQRLAPGAIVDERRFRPNLVLDTGDASGFVENGWLGRAIVIGGLEARISDPTPRCSVPTLSQAGMSQDRSVLEALVAHNRVPVALLGDQPLPCLGVYAFVTQGGGIREGDKASVV